LCRPCRLLQKIIFEKPNSALGASGFLLLSWANSKKLEDITHRDIVPTPFGGRNVMGRSFPRLALLGYLSLGVVASVEARKPKTQTLPPPEKQENNQTVPQPRVLPEQLPPATKAPKWHYSYPRISRYEVWKNLGVDQYGQFRPVVIDSPYGTYYRYNREPFPWATLYPWEYTPYIMGTPYRSAH